MSKTFVYLVLGIIGAIATIIFLQNLQLSLPLRFLGFSSIPLPVGLSMLLFLGIGAITAIPLNWLLLGNGALQPQGKDDDPEVIDVDYIE